MTQAGAGGGRDLKSGEGIWGSENRSHGSEGDLWGVSETRAWDEDNVRIKLLNWYCFLIKTTL